MLDCPKPGTLRLLLEAGVELPDRRNVESHVEHCDRCQEALAQLSALVLPPVSARSAGPELPRVPAPTVTPHVPGYEIIEELGRGGMGVVFKARHVALQRVVALKMVLARFGVDDEQRQRFRTEAEAVARLQHPNIVQVFEVGEFDSQPYLSLELCSGGSLASRLGGSPLPPAEAAQLCETLAQAMDVAHQARVIHRDLKPANILLSATQQPKITDFGLARKLDEEGQTRTNAVMGTPSYMAPEQALGKKDLGPAVDIYALGAILYELLTGRPPFRAASALDTLQLVVGTDAVPVRQINPLVPRDLETICLKCLHKEPTRRYPSAVALADDLSRYRQGRPITARPVSRWERARKWMWRNPLAVALLSVVVLAVAAVGTVGAIYNAQLTQERDDAQKQRGKAERALAFAVKTGAVVDALGRDFHDRNQRDKTLETFQIAIKAMTQNLNLLDAMAAEAPDNVDVRAARASSLQARGDLYAARGKMPESDKDLSRAAAEWETLVTDYPDRLDLATGQAMTQVVMARVHMYIKGNQTEALALCQRAIPVLERAIQTPQTSTLPQSKLTEAYVLRAGVYLGQGKLTESLADWGQAVADRTLPPGYLRLRYELGWAYTAARLGRHQEATKAAERLRRDRFFNADCWTDVAEIYALCAKAAQDATNLPHEQRQAEANRYAKSATEALQQAVAAGRVTSADDLTGNADLRSLVGRPDFETLLAKLRKK